ncbi:MAG TPA: hypothetical protein VNW46_18745 [Gemmatimonadaceae bacterium]|nr:hypothetical protein [Gemmatimonadaceae bacterium]
MSRLAVIAGAVCCVLAAAGCGSSSSSGPKSTFSGAWTGAWTSSSSIVDTLHATQSGTTLTGTDVEHNGGTAVNATINGSVGTSTVTFTISVGGTAAGTFKGTFASATSVTGYFYYSATDSTGLSWTKE